MLHCAVGLAELLHGEECEGSLVDAWHPPSSEGSPLHDVSLQAKYNPLPLSTFYSEYIFHEPVNTLHKLSKSEDTFQRSFPQHTQPSIIHNFIEGTCQMSYLSRLQKEVCDLDEKELDEEADLEIYMECDPKSKSEAEFSGSEERDNFLMISAISKSKLEIQEESSSAEDKEVEEYFDAVESVEDIVKSERSFWREHNYERYKRELDDQDWHKTSWDQYDIFSVWSDTEDTEDDPTSDSWLNWWPHLF